MYVNFKKQIIKDEKSIRDLQSLQEDFRLLGLDPAEAKRDILRDRNYMQFVEGCEDLFEAEEDALNLASNPTTHPNKLHDLLFHPDDNISKAVASNPNIAEHTWAEALVKHPKEAVNNVNYSYPYWPAGIGNESGMAHLENPNLSEKYRGNYRLGMALSYPIGSRDYKDFIQSVSDEDLFDYVDATENENSLNKLADHPSGPIRLQIALNSNTPSDALARLSNDKSAYIRSAVARHNNIDLETLKKMREDSHPEVLRDAMQNYKFKI